MSYRAVLAYIPVLDKGYVDFVSQNYDANIFIFGNEIISRFDHLRKDLRRLDPESIAKSLRALTGSVQIHVLDSRGIEMIRKSGVNILMPDEDVCRKLAEEEFPLDRVQFEFLGLRYDKKKTLENKVVEPDWEVTEDRFARDVMHFAEEKAKRSVDWWRQIGAALTKDGEVFLSAINRPTPNEYALLHMGDPRGNFKKGQFVEYSNVLHAEAAIVAKAARDGISMDGLDLWCTDFPCPPCSRIIAHSGIRRFYFKNGYALLDGDEIMRSQGIQIIRVI